MTEDFGVHLYVKCSVPMEMYLIAVDALYADADVRIMLQAYINYIVVFFSLLRENGNCFGKVLNIENHTAHIEEDANAATNKLDAVSIVLYKLITKQRLIFLHFVSLLFRGR